MSSTQPPWMQPTQFVQAVSSATIQQHPIQPPIIRKPQPVASNASSPGLRQTKHGTPWLLFGLLSGLGLLALVFVGVTLVVVVMRASAAAPVSTLGIDVSGLHDAALIARLNQWNTITVRDGDRQWSLAAAELGVQLDSSATATRVQSGISASDGTVLPVISLDLKRAKSGLEHLAAQVNRPAVNATVRYVGGQLTAVAPVDGRTLDVAATLSRLQTNPAQALSAGTLSLTVQTNVPAVSDARPLLAKAQALLASPLILNVYNPVTDKTTAWTVNSSQWGQWLSVTNTSTNTGANNSKGVQFSLETAALTDYLNRQNVQLGSGQHVDVAHAVSDIQNAVSNNTTTVTVRAYNAPTVYTVQSGDTLGVIAWKVGITMWRISKANPTINTNALSVGQQIALPSKDDLLPLPIVFGKRIVVSISKQHMSVYDDYDKGALKWDWVTSTGIPDSPTMPGVFQVQSHDKNAYGGLWNLWMPNFLGIYEAVPGFMNGIHGLPTLSGGKLLWAGFLGRPITYGCVLLSLENAALLYNWAAEGVVVEIQR